MEDQIISVVGCGNIHVAPDVTRLEVKLISLHDSYEEAYEQAKSNTEKLSAIMENVKLSKILPKTTCLDIDKKTVREYDRHDHYRGDKFIGFELNHIVKINLGMDNVLLNQVVKQIGEQLKQAEINIGYTVKDSRPTQLKMLERAVSDAKEKAQIMAKAAGCKLGRCVRIDYGIQEIHIYSQVRNIHGADEACCCQEESLDITPEDLMTSDTVKTEWILENC